MTAIATVESALNANAKAKTSSATGLFQFTNGTWKEMVRRHGKKYGITNADRRNPKANSIMGALLLRDNKRILEKKGFNPGIRELYLAHFAGIGKAVRVLDKLRSNPDAPVSSVFSMREIRANRGILRGTLQESFNRLTNKVVKAQERLNK